MTQLPTAEPLIICDRLVKIYAIESAEVLALQGLDLTVQRGEMLGIVGSSGSGKSTLMNILGGLDRPTSGKVWVDGQNLLEMNDRQRTRYRKRTVGFVWQQGARNLIPFLTAVENVELPMALAGISAAEARTRAHALLDTVGLGKRAAFQLGQLSGGEQQRVAICVALANHPRLLLADEPTGELDTATAQSIYQSFQALNQQYGVTILIVSHDPKIARHVQRVVTIHDGQIAAETVRARVADGQPGEHTLQELVLVDENGWLCLPRSYLQQCKIDGRAQIEMTAQGILVRPAPEHESTHALEKAARRMVREREEQAQRKGLRRLLAQIGLGSHRKG